MDKYEYKVRADEIKSLIAEGEYAEAVKIADTIDWRRVKSVMMLCTISDLYKINKRYEDSRDILLLAYERRTGGRLIVYSLCELSIKLGEYVQALEYYKEFVQLAPKDSGRYVLQYKLYEAQEVSLEERIEVLEELKKHDYREKWAYELASLYHRVGLASKCVDECNELVLTFGEGRYVMKALELKALHETLSEEQQIKYELMRLNGGSLEPDYVAEQKAVQEEAEAPTEEEEEFSLEENIMAENTQEIPGKELDIQVKTVDVSQYNTINLQKELAESMKEILENHNQTEEPAEESAQLSEVEAEAQRTQIYKPVTGLDSKVHPQEDETEPAKELYLHQHTDEMQLITDEDLQQSEAAEDTAAEVQESVQIKAQQTEEAPAKDLVQQETVQPVNQPVNSEEVFFGNTSEVNVEEVVSELAQKNAARNPFTPIVAIDPKDMPVMPAAPAEEEIPVPVASPDPAISNTGVIRTFNKPSGYDNILSQEYDGQISLVVPEQEKIEKQITGQISIEDVMAEWERMKQENERKRMEEIRRRVQQQTDTLFADFDESTKTGLLEELERTMVAAAMKEEKERAAAVRPKVVKVADIEKAEELKKNPAAETPAEKVPVSEELTEDTAEELLIEEAEELEADQEVLQDTFTEEEASEEFQQEEMDMDELEEDEEEVEELEEIDEEMQEADQEQDLEDQEFEAIDVAAMVSQALMNDIEDDAQEYPSDEYDPIEYESEGTAASEEDQDKSAEEASEDSAQEAAGSSKKNRKKAKAAAAENEAADGKYTAREMTDAEKEQFAPFIHHRRTRKQIVEAIDNISMASYTGNVIITGEEGTGTTALAKLLVKEVQLSDNNFSGKVAKISGVTMNKKDVPATLEKLANGALIIEDASGMKKATVSQLLKELNQEEKGLVVMLEDTRAAMADFMGKYPDLEQVFNLRVDVEALDDQTLVKYAKKYALEQEYSIDELGVLALHTRIADMQTSDHEVTLAEIEELVDEAIYYADRKTPKHFFDILLGKRYDEEDMIVLREKDFMHY